ncbi:MAG: hypothetical protein H0U43_08535 [Chthoniobacterales bacterium]|nr:hypothetical protein [Chthoniobacterales bacterium]
MNWFRHNRFFGTFLVAFAIATLGAIVFLWLAKSGFSETKGRFDQTVSELNRLQHLTPFPNDTNLRKLKTQAEDYAAELNKTKEELTARVLPVKPMAPNEFQARLRQAMAAVGERARANRVKLPDNFFLGFDEFAAALPDTAAAPLLGQQLAQVELLVDIMIDARVDAISSLKRVSAADQRSAPAPTPATTNAAAAARKPAATTPAAPLIERADVDATFVSNPAAARRVLNGISTANQQFYIIRTLHILNEKDKGPPRDEARAVPADTAARATSGTGAAAGNAALNFIVGNERIQTSARVEMLRFTF